MALYWYCHRSHCRQPMVLPWRVRASPMQVLAGVCVTRCKESGLSGATAFPSPLPLSQMGGRGEWNVGEIGSVALQHHLA